MKLEERNHSRKNWGLAVFVFLAGLVFLTNLFGHLPWNIWQMGFVPVVGALLVNYLSPKTIAHGASQILMLVLIFAFLGHTVLAITQPEYLESSSSSLTAYEQYQKTMRLNKDYYQEISKKDFSTDISSGNYIITDSVSTEFFFLLHPPRDPSENISIIHEKKGTTLDMSLQQTQYTLPRMQELLNQYPNVVLGKPHVPISFDIKTSDEGILNITLAHKKVDEFRAILEGGEVNLKVSERATPQESLSFTVREGVSKLYLPKELSHTVKYEIRNDGKLYISDNEIKGRGEYNIISGKNENECTVNVSITGGELRIYTH